MFMSFYYCHLDHGWESISPRIQAKDGWNVFSPKEWGSLANCSRWDIPSVSLYTIWTTSGQYISTETRNVADRIQRSFVLCLLVRLDKPSSVGKWLIQLGKLCLPRLPWRKFSPCCEDPPECSLCKTESSEAMNEDQVILKLLNILLTTSFGWYDSEKAYNGLPIASSGSQRDKYSSTLPRDVPLMFSRASWPYCLSPDKSRMSLHKGRREECKWKFRNTSPLGRSQGLVLHVIRAADCADFNRHIAQKLTNNSLNIIPASARKAASLARNPYHRDKDRLLKL